MLGGGGAGNAKWGVVGVERCVGILGVEADVGAEVEQGFAGAQPSMASGSVADLFTTDSILLVVKGKEGSGYERYLQVIQRRVGGWIQAAIQQEVDVAQAEGFGATN